MLRWLSGSMNLEWMPDQLPTFDHVKELLTFKARGESEIEIQTQACQKIMEETDKEFKKMMERITESCEAMQGSYAEFQAGKQITHSRGQQEWSASSTNIEEEYNGIDSLGIHRHYTQLCHCCSND